MFFFMYYTNLYIIDFFCKFSHDTINNSEHLCCFNVILCIEYYETGNLFEGRSPKISIIR